jgi:ribosome biogenesis protein YTM1
LNASHQSSSFFLLQEAVIEIEYVERQPAPEPEDALAHDDWVAAVAACQD